MDQIFVYLGCIENVRFMIRTVMGPPQSFEEISKTCAQVYQAWIHHELLEENDNMIIFNLVDRAIPVRCYHKDMVRVEIPHELLESTFKRLLSTDRSADKEILIIRLSHEHNRYDLIEVNEAEPLEEIKRLMLELSKTEFKMDKIESSMVTTKPMDYLKDM